MAPLGTALTEEQLELLWRLAPEPILCFDGDAAGQRAAARAAERALPLLKPGHSLRFALLPAGEDPDSLVRAGRRRAMRDDAATVRPLAELLWDMSHGGAPVRHAGAARRVAQATCASRPRRIADRAVQRVLPAEFETAPARRPSAAGGSPALVRKARPRRAGPAAAGRAGRDRASRSIRACAATADVGVPDLRRATRLLLAGLVNHPVLLAEHGEEVAEISLPSVPTLTSCATEILKVCGPGP